MSKLFSLLLCAILIISTDSFLLAQNSSVTILDTIYTPEGYPDTSLAATIFIPPLEKNKGIGIVLTHGATIPRLGAKYWCDTLAARGYVAMTIDYYDIKVIPYGLYPKPVRSAKTAVEFLRKNADRFGIYKKNSIGNPVIVAFGQSQGSLVWGESIIWDNDDAYFETNPAIDDHVDGAILLYGYYDNLNAVNSLAEPEFTTYFSLDPPLRGTKGQCITNVSNITTPVLLLHGNADDLVSVYQSRWLRDSLAFYGKSNKLIEFNGAGHAFDYNFSTVSPGFTSMGLLAKNYVLAFLDTLFKPVEVSNDCIHPNPGSFQFEPSIATHPLNPDIVLIAADARNNNISRIGWYYTNNGGESWKGRDTLPTQSNFSVLMTDPAAAIDHGGNLFVSGIYGNNIILARSTDEGLNWTQKTVGSKVVTSMSLERPHMTIDQDQNSPNKNNIYVAYTEIRDPNPGPIFFSASTDQGNNFSTPQIISGNINNSAALGVNLAVAAEGIIYATWSGFDTAPFLNPQPFHLGFNISTDGGASWGNAKSIRMITFNGSAHGVDFLNHPVMAVDRSNGGRKGCVYIAYAERNPSAPDIFLIRSSDQGETWSNPVKVNQDSDNSRDQWLPWMTVDPSNGNIYVAYYDSRNFSANDSAQVYISVSTDGGETFSDILISEVPFLPTMIQDGTPVVPKYMGSYIGITANGGKVWAAWNDNRSGLMLESKRLHQIYTFKITSLPEWLKPIYLHDVITNKSYYTLSKDTVHLATIIENQNYHQISARAYIKTGDDILVDSVNLSKQTVNGTSENWSVNIIPTVEEFYKVSVTAFDETSVKSFTLHNATGYTTAGPLTVDSIAYLKIGNLYYLKPFIRSLGNTKTIKGATIRMKINDPWVTSVSSSAVSLPDIAPGSLVNASGWLMAGADSTLPGYFNIKFEMLSGGYVYWTDSVKYYIPGWSGIENEENLPKVYSLAQNYPNPFNPSTTIKYSIPKTNKVKLILFNLLGEEVATLVNEEKNAGNYSVGFNSAVLPSGVYFYQLKAGDFIQTKKMVLLK
jgi:dienelactone hydrolase